MKRSNTKKLCLFLLAFVVFISFDNVWAQYTDNDGYPYVVSTRPANRQGGISTSTQISATLSEVIDPASVTSNTFFLSGSMGSPVPGQVSCAGRSITFIPFTRLGTLSTYNVTITSDIRSTTGEPIMRNYSWKFSTGTN